jgi:DNA-binding NarL/FixJ family response regulator
LSVRSAKKLAQRAPRGLVATHFEVAGERFVVFAFPAAPPKPAQTPLSASETHVLQLIIGGRSNAEIAAARSTSVRTVANQVASILKKLGVGSRYELARRSAR